MFLFSGIGNEKKSEVSWCAQAYLEYIFLKEVKPGVFLKISLTSISSFSSSADSNSKDISD